MEHLEDIGVHYYQTLRCWRENFLKKQRYESRKRLISSNELVLNPRLQFLNDSVVCSEINDLGFDDKFVRTWEYYFDYCAAGFKTCTLGNYQVCISIAAALFLRFYFKKSAESMEAFCILHQIFCEF